MALGKPQAYILQGVLGGFLSPNSGPHLVSWQSPAAPFFAYLEPDPSELRGWSPLVFLQDPHRDSWLELEPPVNLRGPSQEESMWSWARDLQGFTAGVMWGISVVGSRVPQSSLCMFTLTPGKNRVLPSATYVIPLNSKG